jgi:hypothetical protein
VQTSEIWNDISVERTLSIMYFKTNEFLYETELMKYYKENFVQSTKAGSLRVIDFSQATPKSTNVEAKYFYLEKAVFY